MIINCTFNVSTHYAIIYNSTNHGKLIAYNNTINVSGNIISCFFGEDTPAPTYSDMTIDFRGNSVVFADGYGSHGVLFGRGTTNVECYNNTITLPSTSLSSAIGIVVKTIATTIGDAIFSGNYIVSPRPFIFKGASKSKAEYNSCISNYSTRYGHEVDNVAEEIDLTCQENVFQYNNVIGNIGMVFISNTTTMTAIAAILTCSYNYNKYYSLADLYIKENTNDITWEQLATFWGENTNDNASRLLNIKELPIIAP